MLIKVRLSKNPHYSGKTQVLQFFQLQFIHSQIAGHVLSIKAIFRTALMFNKGILAVLFNGFHGSFLLYFTYYKAYFPTLDLFKTSYFWFWKMFHIISLYFSIYPVYTLSVAPRTLYCSKDADLQYVRCWSFWLPIARHLCSSTTKWLRQSSRRPVSIHSRVAPSRRSSLRGETDWVVTQWLTKIN